MAGVTFGDTGKNQLQLLFWDQSAVIPNKTIGDNDQVMAGSLVISNVESNVMVVEIRLTCPTAINPFSAAPK